MRIYGDIQKVTANPDGTITVAGIASTETRDSQGEIVLASAMKAAIPAYMSFGAVREMHQPKAAGTALAIHVDDATKTTHFEALIVDEGAIKKVQKGVYKGFSIGGKVEKRKVDDHAVIEGIQLTEISLVDRPANPEARIGLWKADAPATADYSYEGEEINDASTAMRALEALAYLYSKEKDETGEPTGQASMLQLAIQQLKRFIASEIVEDHSKADQPAAGTPQLSKEDAVSDPTKVAEAPPQEPPPAEPVEKAGRKYSKATATALRGLRKAMNDAQTCMKAFDDLGDEDGDNVEPDGDNVEPDGDNVEPDGDEEQMKAQLAESLAKVSGLNDELKKAQDRISGLEKENATLKAQPAPSPAELAVVQKKDDATVTKTEEPVDDSPMGLMKRAQASPRAMF